MNFRNKLECSSFANLFKIVQCMKVRQEPSQVIYLSGATRKGRLLALPINNRLGWKDLKGANTLADYNIGPWCEVSYYIFSNC
jgi:hypothetical protein